MLSRPRVAGCKKALLATLCQSVWGAGSLATSLEWKEVRSMWEFDFSSNAEWVVGVLLAAVLVIAMTA